MGLYELGRVPRIVAGDGALKALLDGVNGLSDHGAVMIVDQAVALTGYAGRVATVLHDMALVQHVVAAGEPTVDSVNAAAQAVRSLPGAVVVGVGGGSALDTAKQAAVVAAGESGIEAYLLCANPFAGRRPIIAIPTTSGTGAEVTRTCIVSDADGTKLWTWGDEMLPDLVLLDPAATVTMPAHVTIATGLDAFVHTLEACSGQRRNTMSAAPAMQALRLVSEHLPNAVADGGNLVARSGMQEAALLAGTAIDNCGTGIAHSIGHALGSLYHVPHGVAVAVGLDASIEWNVAGSPECFESASVAFNASAADVPNVLRDLFAATSFSVVVHRLPDVVLDAAAIADMMIAEENQPMVANNCRVPTDSERSDLAAMTVESWLRLRAEGADAMSLINRIEITHHQLPLDPPFPASWDTQPRTKFPATIVRVHDDEGRVGIGSGDAMYGFADYQRYFLGHDPTDLDRHAAVLANIEFHAGRPWPVDVALWDLAGKIRGEPIWHMVGGRNRRIRAYASSGVHRPVDEMVGVARRVIELGFPALKVRFGRPRLEDDLAVIKAVRDAAGQQLELMVDCNQGWRMPWDTQVPWDVDHATRVARALEAENVYWMEEPLHRGDYAGMAELRSRVGISIAGGEMTREPYEFRELLARDCLDVFQPDAVCSMGISGLRHLASEVEAAGKVFTPHTWGNGIGLMANLHLTAGTVDTPFIEFPFDPPEWSTARRDYVLTATIEADGDGWIALSDRPGLGIDLDEDVLASTQTGHATFVGYERWREPPISR